MVAWNVYLRGALVDSVFFLKGITKEEVRLSLINHDGYHPNIVIKKAKKQ